MEFVSHHNGQVPFIPSTTSPSLAISSSLSPSSTLPPRLANHDPSIVQLDCDRQDEHWASGKTQGEHQSETYIEVQHPDEAVNSTDISVEEQMKQPKTKATIGILSTLITYISLNSWYRTTHPEAFVWQSEDREEAAWVATSKSWLDRKACRWLGMCGLPHFHFTRLHLQSKEIIANFAETSTSDDTFDWQNAWMEADKKPDTWNKSEKVLRQIPDYVIKYAPLVHLFSGEQYWPCDIAEHLVHTTPALNYTPVESNSSHPTLRNLNEYNQYDRGRWVFLTSNDDPEGNPDWLGGEKNIPSTPDNPDDGFEDNAGWVHHPGRTYIQGLKDAVGDLKDWFAAGGESNANDDMEESATAAKAHAKILKESKMILHEELKRQEDSDARPHRIRGGRSDAPAVLVVIDKGHGVVDAFWFFFYSFNLGNTVFNVRFGNHIGDWEHSAIRFHKGEPKAVFFSEHNFGSAYSYDAVEKLGQRPVIYSAVGSHAMYATSGSHPYVLPWGILHDQTDRGPLWDPALNSHMYTYDHEKDILRSSNLTPQAPTQWFHFGGHWGDKFYPLGDKRQYRFAGQYHYVNGPLGPKFKNLGRKKICGGPDSAPCIIKHWLGGENKFGRLQSHGEEADLYPAEAEQLGVQR